MIKRLKNESGYSLVEVMVAIMLLGLAIIPMVSMFDAGLRASVVGSNYDKARSLANLKLEQAKSLPYSGDTIVDVKNNFPVPLSTPGSGSGYYASGYRSAETELGAEYKGFEYKIEKQYLDQPDTDPVSSAANFSNSNTDQGLIKVTVTVKWGSGSTYSTSGVVAE